MALENYSYLGVGRVSMREAGAAAGLFEVGNVEGFTLNKTTTDIFTQNFQDVGGGRDAEVSRLESVELAAVLTHLSPDNLIKGLRATKTAVSTDPVVDEEHENAYPGSTVITVTPGTVTAVKIGMTTLDVDVDYEIVPGGIRITDDGEVDYLGATVLISYTPDAGALIQPLLTTGRNFEVVFSGINEFLNTAYRFHGWKWRPRLASTLPMIGAEFARLELVGPLVRDSAKAAAGKSPFYELFIGAPSA